MYLFLDVGEIVPAEDRR